MKKVVITALVGGLVVYLWSFLSHMALPIGSMGVDTMKGEDAVIAALQDLAPEPGFYLFPGEGYDGSEAEQEAWMKKVETGPRGVVVYDPRGGSALAPSTFLIQLLTDLAAAFLAALILRRLTGGVLARALHVASMGVFAWLMVSVPQWNWYRFPFELATGVLLDQGIGWLLAGLAMAKVMSGPGGPVTD